MFAEETLAPLMRLKALIWGHAVVGTALALIFFQVIGKGAPGAAVIALIVCGVVWAAGVTPLEKRAERLAPEDREPARGLPGPVLLLWALGEFVSLTWWGTPWGSLLIPAHLLLGLTLLLRGLITLHLGLPFHGSTWFWSLMNVSMGLALHGIVSFVREVLPGIIAGC